MSNEYRLLNIVVSLDQAKNPKVLSDIAIFEVDRETGVNTFVEIKEMITSLYPYTQELIVNNSTDVVVLDDVKFNGQLKTLLLKNKGLLMTALDHQYKDYIYVVCKLGEDAYLVYSSTDKEMLATYSDLVMYDEVGRLFNAKLVESTVRGKKVYKVVCGGNSAENNKATKGIEVRQYDAGRISGNKGSIFALDVASLKQNPAISDLEVSEGQLKRFTLREYEGGNFKLMSTFRELTNGGRSYRCEGNLGELDLSVVKILKKNSLLLKSTIQSLILSEDMSNSSNLDFLVYSLQQYTGDIDYKLGQLVIQEVSSNDTLDLVIKLLAELRFNTDTFNDCDIEYFPIQSVVFEGALVEKLLEQYQGDREGYIRWVTDGLFRFSVVLLENYNKALGYLKKYMKKSGKGITECSLDVLDLLSDYEQELLEITEFFTFASSILLGADSNDYVCQQIYNLVTKNAEERTNMSGSNIELDDILNDVLGKM